MVKPPLRTKSIGFKVSQEEYAQPEAGAQTDGRTLGEWCREVILRGGSASDAARPDPALAEIVGVRLLLVNVLGPVAAGEKVTREKFNQLLDQISEAKHELAAKLQRVADALRGSEPKQSGNRGRGHGMSAAARRKIAAAQRKRWRKLKSGAQPARPKRTISAAGRKRIAAAQRARWAKIRAKRKKAA